MTGGWVVHCWHLNCARIDFPSGQRSTTDFIVSFAGGRCPGHAAKIETNR